MIMKFLIIALLSILGSAPAWGENVRIKRILIEAPAGFEIQPFRSNIRIREGSTYSSSNLNDELKRIYLDGTYQNLTFLPISRGQGQIDLKIIIDPKLLFGSIDFKGYKFFSKKELIEISKLEPNQDLSNKSIARASQLLAAAYQDQGYYQVKIESALKPSTEPLKVNVTFTVYEGSPTKIRRIIIEGPPLELVEQVRDDLDLERFC